MTDTARTEALFREHHERLARYARHLVGAGADAEDLVQETFLRAHRYLCNGKEIRAPLSFLFVTMRNIVNDASRHGGVAREQPSADTDVLVQEEAPSVERQALSEREFEVLCAAIAKLPERMRHAFVLRKVYGYSCREIAEQLGRSTNTVRDQVAQGFRKLHALRGRSERDDLNARAPVEVRPGASEEAKDRKHVHAVPLAPVARRGTSG